MAISDLANQIGVDANLHVIGRWRRVPKPDVIGLEEAETSAWRALQGASVMLVGGGIIEPHPDACINRFERLLEKLRPRSVSLFSANVESGKRYSLFQRHKLREQLNRVDHTLVRDVRSMQALRDLVPKRRVEVSGDIVLWLQPDDSIQLFERHSYLAVSLAPRWDNEPAWFEWVSKELAGLAEETALGLVFVPLSTYFDDDRPIHRRVAGMIQSIAPGINCVTLDEHMGPRAVLRVLADARAVIGMRLHSCVMAFSQSAPFVGIGYHPKVYGFAETVGMPNGVVLPPTPPTQAGTGYGYGFDEGRFKARALIEATLAAIADPGSSRLTSLREGLAKTFSDIMEITTAGKRREGHSST